MKVNTALRLESVKEYYFSKKLREVAGLIQAGKPVLNMGIGSPDLPHILLLFKHFKGQ